MTKFCPWCTPLWKSFCLMHPFMEKFLLDAPLLKKRFLLDAPLLKKRFSLDAPQKKPGWSRQKQSPQVHDPEEQHFPCPDLPALPRVKRNKFEWIIREIDFFLVSFVTRRLQHQKHIFKGRRAKGELINSEGLQMANIVSFFPFFVCKQLLQKGSKNKRACFFSMCCVSASSLPPWFFLGWVTTVSQRKKSHFF